MKLTVISLPHGGAATGATTRTTAAPRIGSANRNNNPSNSNNNKIRFRSANSWHRREAERSRTHGSPEHKVMTRRTVRFRLRPDEEEAAGRQLGGSWEAAGTAGRPQGGPKVVPVRTSYGGPARVR